MSQNAIIICSSWFALISLVTFGVYGFDKRRAKQEGQRISEKALHILSLIGGWPGAIAGQKLFRHKTVKTRFRIIFWLTVAGNMLVTVILYAAYHQMTLWFASVFAEA